MMTLYRWEIINADGDCIGTVVTGRKDKAVASEKIKAKLGDNAYFVRLGKCREEQR